MGKHTPFYELHIKSNAKMVDFAGWDMPLHYGSQIQEHHQVRQHVGLFDISHMGIVDLTGEETTSFLRHLLANDIDKISPGRALYTCMLNDQGGILDDLIVYYLSKNKFRLVINAGTREKDIAWIQAQAQNFKVTIVERTDLTMLAIQGPEVKEKIKKFMPFIQARIVLNLKPFHFLAMGDWFVARTGYTGEDGFEIIFPAKDAEKIWHKLIEAGVTPCGLGSRDTLRLEAGLNLYGSDMDETTTPFESNLGWTVALEKDRQFIGRPALEAQTAQGIDKQLVGLVLEGPGVIRNHQTVVFEGDGSGLVTSGGYSPTLEKSIALARVPKAISNTCYVQIRDKKIPAQVVKPPFVRHGKKMF